MVPARDEQGRIHACLASVRHALDVLPAHIDTAVTVVLDRCRDRTPQMVAALAAGWPQLHMLNATDAGHTGRRRIHADDRGVLHIVPGSGIGALRHLGVRHTLAALDHPPGVTWLLDTDADTIVPPTWALDHLRYAARGVVGVAGMADLDTTDDLSAHARRHYRTLMAQRVHGKRHTNVFGANLGVRADAYLDVGGFPLDSVGEDHLLWEHLRATGLRTERPTAVRVTTSARLHGRACGGLANLLYDMHQPAEDEVVG